MLMDSERKLLQSGVGRMSFSTTGPVYKRNCLNSIAFQRSNFESDLGFRANLQGMYFDIPTSFSEMARILMELCLYF